MNSQLWYEYLDNPKSITSVYTEPPGLSNVVVLWMEYQGSIMNLAIRMNKYPDHPPQKWDKRNNTVAAYFSFDNVRIIEQRGLPAYPLVNIQLWRHSKDQLEILIEGTHFVSHFNSDSMRFLKYNSYVIESNSTNSLSIPYVSVSPEHDPQGMIAGTTKHYYEE